MPSLHNKLNIGSNRTLAIVETVYTCINLTLLHLLLFPQRIFTPFNLWRIIYVYISNGNLFVWLGKLLRANFIHQNSVFLTTFGKFSHCLTAPLLLKVCVHDGMWWISIVNSSFTYIITNNYSGKTTNMAKCALYISMFVANSVFSVHCSRFIKASIRCTHLVFNRSKYACRCLWKFLLKCLSVQSRF